MIRQALAEAMGKALDLDGICDDAIDEILSKRNCYTCSKRLDCEICDVAHSPIRLTLEGKFCCNQYEESTT